MNIATIMAVIGALLAGGFASSAIIDRGQEGINKYSQEDVRTIQEIDTMPEAIDFVSVRPEIDALPIEELSAEEIEHLEYMREEEKLARDVYTTLYETWGLQIFSNIAQSEQMHTEAVRDLLVKYDMADPSTDNTTGVFTNQTLQELYDSLVAQGSVSELEALKVGALIEDLDIFDLQNALRDVDNADITLVFENLERGSRNHLRAFMSQIESQGGTYEPQYLTQEAFDTIKNSEREKGNHSGMQEGGGRGEGRGEGRKGF